MAKIIPSDIYEKEEKRFLKEWKELLSFPSISADPAHAYDCLACATWLVKHLDGIGFTSRLLVTSGQPVVFAERKGNPKKPVVLFYGHYDVQPVDPLDEWQNPLFQGKVFPDCSKTRARTPTSSPSLSGGNGYTVRT